MLPITPQIEIQKLLKDRGHYSGDIDGIQDDDYIAGVERWMFEMGVLFAGWSKEKKLIAAEELLYETQGIDVGLIDGLDDSHLQYAREIYNAKNTLSWRDKSDEIHTLISSVNTGSEWAKKYTLTINALGITAEQYDAYRKAVGYIESRNNPSMGSGGAGGHYWGMYQFGSAATEDTSSYLRETVSKEDFAGNQDLAEKYFDALSYLNNRYLTKNSKYVAMKPTEKLAVLGYAHNQGAGGASKWLNSGIEGKDAFGTSGAKYYNEILKAIKNLEGVSSTKIVVDVGSPTISSATFVSKKIIFIGDSVALGLYDSHKNGGIAFAKIGIGPKAILEMIWNIDQKELRNNLVILSPGLLNNVSDTSTVSKIIDFLLALNCEVRLVGGPKTGVARADLALVNGTLSLIAVDKRIRFLGPYSSKDGVHPDNYTAYDIGVTTFAPPSTTTSSATFVVNPAPTSIFDIREINIYQLAFIRGIGQTETGFDYDEAYSERYNKASNNRNVRQYGEDGADYGYFQCNALDVKDCIRKGVTENIAKHLNGGGARGKSTIAEQTVAMHEYINRLYPAIYENLKSGDDGDLENAIDAMDGRWFGLKDRPEEVRKIWKKVKGTSDLAKLFPEVKFDTPGPIISFEKLVEVKPLAVSSIITPAKKYNWPKQSECSNFYGEVGTNQVKCVMPFQLVLAWEPQTKLNSYSCHKLVKEPMERIWNRTFEYYGYEKIKEMRLHYFGGCLNVRKMRGGSSWSMHSWGIAADIDPDRNGFKTTWNDSQMSKPEYAKFVEFWYDEGAINLGKERDFDPMHYQFARL